MTQSKEDVTATAPDRTLTLSGLGPAFVADTSSRWGEQAFLDVIEGAPREEIEALQERKLLDQMKLVAERSALTREVWQKAGVDPLGITSLADFKARAPFIDKDKLRAYRDRTGDPFGGVLCVDAGELHNIGSSSGTTGDPTVFAERWNRGYEGPFTPREYWGLGLRPGDYVLELNAVMRGVGQRLVRMAGGIPLMLNHDPYEVEQAVEWILKYRPTIFFHLSSPVIYGLERLEREKGIDMIDLFSSFKACIYGGEPIGPRMQRTLDRWQVKVIEFSSLGDSGTIWECHAKDGFHAWEDIAIVEVLEPGTDRPVPDGEGGELVVTAIHNRTDPLIRYRSGDFVRHTREKCACGRTHARLWPVGRLDDEVLVNGNSILPRDIWTAIEEVPETAAALFQIIRPRRELTELRLRVGYEGEPDDLDDVAKRVADEVEARVAVRPVVMLTPNAELIKLGPPHKIPRVAKA